MKSLVIAIVLWCFAASDAAAGVIPGRWDKVAALKPGTGIIVTLKSGERTECSFLSLGPDSLRIWEAAGTVRMLPRLEVLGIITAANVPDSRLNGALIGAGAGFGAGFLSLAGFNAKATASGPIWTGEDLSYYTTAGLVGAAVGALVGTIIDSAHKHPQELFQARREQP